MKNPFEGGLSYDSKMNNKISNQTSGGSMFGMPSDAQKQMQENPNVEMPTAKEVATDNKVFNQVEPDRKAMWQPPKQNGISKGNLNVPAAQPTEGGAPTAGVQVDANQMYSSEDVNPESLSPDLTGIKEEFENTQMDEETAGELAKNKGVIDTISKEGSDQDKKDTTREYVNRTESELEKKANSKWQLWATIASIAAFAFTGGLIPPINFIKLTGQEDARNKWNEIKQKLEESELLPASEVKGMQSAGQQKETDTASFETGTKAISDVQAAKGGEQTKKELDWKYLKDQMNLSNDQAQAMAKLKSDLDTKSAIDIINAQSGANIEEKKEAAKLLASQMTDAMKAVGMQPTPENLKNYARYIMGEDAFTKNAAIVTNGIGAIAGAAAKFIP